MCDVVRNVCLEMARRYCNLHVVESKVRRSVVSYERAKCKVDKVVYNSDLLS